MDIQNVTEFRNFVNNNKLRGLHHEIDAVAICVEDYERGCSCWKAGDRQKIYDNCKALYIRAAGTVARQFAAQFAAYSLNGIIFSVDGVRIAKVGC